MLAVTLVSSVDKFTWMQVCDITNSMSGKYLDAFLFPVVTH